MSFTLVVPCYNESKSIKKLVAAASGFADVDGARLLLVDNGSTDNTGEVLKEVLAENSYVETVRVEVNQGYGFGIKAGLEACDTDYLGWSHADLQTDPMDAIVAYKKLLSSPRPDLTFLKGVRRGRPVQDVFFTVAMSFFESVLLRTPLWDINAQPNVFHRTLLSSQKWRSAPHDFSFDLYMYWFAKKAGFNIQRFPVNFGIRQHGVSHWNIGLASKLKFIRRTLAYSFALRKALQNQA